MLDAYKSRLLNLSPQEAGLVASELYRRRVVDTRLVEEETTGTDPADLAKALSSCQILAADLVAILLPVAGPVAQNALEKLMGRPITHLPPQSAPPPAPRHEGARPVVPDVGPTGRRTIHRIAPNPKRAGTGAHARFALYHEGQTVAEYLAAGGVIRDVSWDARQGFITLVDPGPAPRPEVYPAPQPE